MAVRLVAHVLMLCMVSAGGVAAQSASTRPESPALDRAGQAEFLRTAKVIRSRRLSSGVTAPYRLTLTDGTVTHDAAFQSVYERRAVANFGARGFETNFVDSHHFNLAAFRIAGMLGLDAMMPVTVHRTWNGNEGTITWWIDDAFDERTRLKERRAAPDAVRWAQQMHTMRVFAALVGDSDRNLGNVLITPDWKLWMIDFTRAFRLTSTLSYPQDLQQVSRSVLAGLRTLDAAAMTAATSHCLTPAEIEAVMKRRDALVAHFEVLIREKGQGFVLFGAPRTQ